MILVSCTSGKRRKYKTAKKEKGRQGKNEEDFPGFATDMKKINSSIYNNFNQSMISQSTETVENITCLKT